MPRRQVEFRADYRPRISPWYSGVLHVVVIYAIGLAALAYVIPHIHDPSWTEWLVVPAVFLASNLFEWWIHRYVMHRLRDVFALRAIYDRHTRQHHQYFTDNDPTIHTVREFRIVFFPWRVLVVLLAAGGLVSWLIGVAVNSNAGYVAFVTMVGHYMVYETFHFCCHIPENDFLRRVPFVNTIRRHHRAHHNMGIMMHCNMNLTFPVADWAMGTSDLDRGLVGHLFNGCDETHVKEELKPVMARFRASETQDARCTLDGPRLDAEELGLIERSIGHAQGLGVSS
jgi:hypothetical protein